MRNPGIFLSSFPILFFSLSLPPFFPMPVFNYCVSGTAVGVGETVVSKTDKVLTLYGTVCLIFLPTVIVLVCSLSH